MVNNQIPQFIDQIVKETGVLHINLFDHINEIEGKENLFEDAVHPNK